MRDNASVSWEPSITFFETDLLLLDPEILFLSVNPKSLFRILSVTIMLFLSVNPKSLFRSGLWLLSCFWAWIRRRYFESGLWLLSCFWAWIRSRYLESDLYLLSSSAHRYSNFVINTRFSLVIRSTWVSETYSYSWYCPAVPALH
jgi:hypothetical protein